jgi:hypothetical protein
MHGHTTTAAAMLFLTGTSLFSSVVRQAINTQSWLYMALPFISKHTCRLRATRQGASGGTPFRSTPAGASPLTSFTGGVAGGVPAEPAAANAAASAAGRALAAAAAAAAAGGSWLMDESAGTRQRPTSL